MIAKTLFTEEELRNLYEQQRLSTRAIAQIKGCHHETVREYLVLYGIPRRSVAEAKIKYPRRSFSGDSTEMAYLLGFRAGDLCVYKANRSDTSQTITVACTSTVAEQDVNILRACWATLQELGVICPPVYLIKQKGSRDADGPLYHKDYWGLGIYRRESLCRLFSLIAPHLKHPKRRRDMLAAWENAKARLSQSQGGKNAR